MYPLIPSRLEYIYLGSRVLFVTRYCIWLVILMLVVVTWLVVDSVPVSLVVAVVLGLFRAVH